MARALKRLRAAAEQGPGNAVAPAPALEATLLLRPAFAGLEGRPLTVFDAGPADAASVAFYNRFRCRVYFADLLADDASPRAGLSALGLEADTRFDLVFLWDVLNRVDGPGLSELVQGIDRHCGATTRLHAFAAYSPRLPLAERRCGIVDFDRFTVRSTGATLPHPRGRPDVVDAFPRFDAAHATLLPDNRLELLLTQST